MLRTSLVPSLLAAKRANRNMGRSVVRLFELAPVCVPGQDEPKELLAILDDVAPGESDEDVLLRVKGTVGRAIGVAEAARLALAPVPLAAGLPQGAPHVVDAEGEMAWSVSVDGQKIGFIGVLTPSGPWDMKSRPVLAEIALAALCHRDVPQFRPLPRFPSIARVLTLDLLESVTWEAIVQEARKLKHDWRSEPAFVHPPFRDKRRLGAYDKAYTFRVEYRAPDRTLTDKDVKPIHDDFVAKLCKALDAHVRE
jgi:phenylalanyl-tRNA synthetase beta subunit